MNKRLYIETVGCQMNVLDSEMVVADLRKRGYELARELSTADVILFNTCSVREQAENKTYSALGRLRSFKKENPDKIIGVMGCMAQKDQQLVFNRAPYVDLVVGPGQLARIPDLIDEIAAGKGQQMAVSLGRKDGPIAEIKRSHETFDPLRDPAMRPTPFQAYLRIQIGCDKFCTYCIVPMTRGPEQGQRERHERQLPRSLEQHQHQAQRRVQAQRAAHERLGSLLHADLARDRRSEHGGGDRHARQHQHVDERRRRVQAVQHQVHLQAHHRARHAMSQDRVLHCHCGLTLETRADNP